MNLTLSELSKKISATTNPSPSETEQPTDAFSALLKPSSPDPDERSYRSLFALVEEEEMEEEQDQKSIEASASSTLLATTPLPVAMDANGVLASQKISPSSAVTTALHIEALFEKMASRMIIMDLSHETHTTLVLDQPQLEGSVFFGTTITIKEFTTAPKTFNIEILSNPAAIATIVQQQDHLLCLFSKGNFPFTIHRLDTGIHQESSSLPLVSRYEEGEERQQEQHEDQDS